jgi:ankyrin repeat protein
VQRDRGLLDANDGYDTPLTAAAWNGRVEVIRFLLEEGAEVDLLSPLGASALEEACVHGYLETASLLLAHGADAAAAWGEGDTPLMSASRRGSADVVALLLAHGCGDIDRRRSDGLMALYYACAPGHVRVVRALLGAGADPHVVDHDDHTPLAMAVRMGRGECVAEVQVSSVSPGVIPRMCVFCHTCSDAQPDEHPPLPSRQAWECRYLLTKARGLRDAASTTASTQAPAYVASRVTEEWWALPVVEVRGVPARGDGKGDSADDRLLVVREAVMMVVNYVM